MTLKEVITVQSFSPEEWLSMGKRREQREAMRTTKK
jgi:hypothetical protein